jgi:hypothetical protein
MELLKYPDWDSELVRLRRLNGRAEAIKPVASGLSIQDLAKNILAPELVPNACRNLTEQLRSMHVENIDPFGWLLPESVNT